MEVTRQLVLAFTLIFGPLVLASYAYGISHAEKPMELWGGIPQSWQGYIVPFMFIAAIGFLVYWYIVFFQFEGSTIDSMRWPWATDILCSNSDSICALDREYDSPY